MVTTKHSAVVGVFRDYAAAEEAVAELRQEGFRNDQIELLVRYKKDIKHRTRKRKVEEVAVTKGITGPVVLGTEAEVEEEVAAPKAPRILSKKGEATTALVGLGVPELEARIYEQELQSGRTLVVVQDSSHPEKARAVLQRARAVDMTNKIERERKRVEKEKAEAEEKARKERERADEKLRREREKAQGKEKTPALPARSGTLSGDGRPARSRTTSGDQTVEVHAEELHATKQPVKKGEVKVRKELVTEHKTLDVPVTREEVVVERKPVRGRRAAGSDMQGEEIRIPVMEEKVRVEKRPVVKEEVHISKRQVQDTRQVSGSVRKERARVETEGDVKVSPSPRKR